MRRDWQCEKLGLVLSVNGSTGRWDSMYLKKVRRRRKGGGKEIPRF
jgi:hypothetical protein